MRNPEAAATGNTGTLLALLAFGNFIVGIGAFVVVGIVGPIASGLGISNADAALVLTAYAIGYALLSPVGATLTGRWPRRTVLSAALAIFTVGTILSALSTSLPFLAGSRLVVAFGAALYTPLSAGVAVALAPPDQRGRALAKVFGGMTIAQVLGVPVGAWLAYRYGWQASFWPVGVLAAIGAPLLYRMIPAELAVPSTTWSTVAQALVNWRLVFAIAFTATIMTAIYAVYTYFGPLIERAVGSNAELRSFYLILFGIGAVAGNMAGGFLTDRIGSTRTLLIICAAQALLMPAITLTTWGPITFAVLVAVWSSFGWSFMAPQQNRLAQAAPQAQTLALALNAAMIYVGIALGSGLAALILRHSDLSALGIGGAALAFIAALHLIMSDRALVRR